MKLYAFFHENRKGVDFVSTIIHCTVQVFTVFMFKILLLHKKERFRTELILLFDSKTLLYTTINKYVKYNSFKRFGFNNSLTINAILMFI